MNNYLLEIDDSKTIKINEFTYNRLLSFATAYYEYHKKDTVPEYDFSHVINELFDMIGNYEHEKNIATENVLINDKGPN